MFALIAELAPTLNLPSTILNKTEALNPVEVAGDEVKASGLANPIFTLTLGEVPSQRGGPFQKVIHMLDRLPWKGLSTVRSLVRTGGSALCV